MSLGNANYDTYMSRDVITRCDVKLYTNSGTSFLDKTKIVSFKMTRKNEGVVSKAPYDNTVIDYNLWHNRV